MSPAGRRRRRRKKKTGSHSRTAAGLSQEVERDKGLEWRSGWRGIRRRGGEFGRRGITEKCREGNVQRAGIYNYPFSHWKAIHYVIASRPDLRHGKRAGLSRPFARRRRREQHVFKAAIIRLFLLHPSFLPSDSLNRRRTGNLLS